MKPENKLPVLDLISAEMKTVVNTLQPDLPPWPATGTIAEQRQYYTLERRFWNVGAPEMATRAYRVPTKYGQVKTRIFYPQPDSPATLFYLHGGGFILGNLDTHDRIMRLLASYSQCTVIGIDYTLSPEARFPQAIEVWLPVVISTSRRRIIKSICPALVLLVIPQVPCWRSPVRCGCAINRSIAVKLRAFCCGMGFTDYGIP